MTKKKTTGIQSILPRLTVGLRVGSLNDLKAINENDRTGSGTTARKKKLNDRLQYVQDIQRLTANDRVGSFSELHHPLILENAKRQLCPDPDIRRMSGGEDASFSGFQVFRFSA